MGRIAGRPPCLASGLMLLVALLFASGSRGSPPDEPKSKETAEKKAGKSKPKASNAKKKADESKSSSPEERKKVEEKARLKDVAFKVAESYLVLLDKGKYGESWEAMTADFRKGITRRKWVDALGKTRTPFGRFQGRKLKRIELRATEVAEKYDEAWIYDDFRTADGETASELIIVVLEKGKDWVVNSYYIGDPASFPKPPVLDEEDPKPATK